MSFFYKIYYLYQNITKILWDLLIIALPCCIFISSGNALMRKILNIGSNALLEIQWYLFSAIFLLGAGHVFKNDAHIRIDIFYTLMPHKVQKILNIILHSFLSIPALLFILYLSLPFFMTSIAPPHTDVTFNNIFYYIYNSTYHEISVNAGGLSTWYAKILLPLGIIFLLLAVIADIIKQTISLFDKRISEKALK